MKLACAIISVGLGLATVSADAKGCIKGAVVGGIAGHMAGHHGAIGAAAGCAIGHHEAKKHQEHGQEEAPAEQH